MMNNVAARKAELVAKAAASMAKWPQYKGYFDDVTLCRVNQRIKTKAGLAFEPGDEALVLPATPDQTPGFTTVWSFRNQIATSIPTKAVELV